MGIRLPGITNPKRLLQVSVIPRGHLAVYVGEKRKRFVIPISYLNQPMFRDLLSLSEEEFGYDHPAGGLTIPCCEDMFTDLVSLLAGS